MVVDIGVIIATIAFTSIFISIPISFLLKYSVKETSAIKMLINRKLKDLIIKTAKEIKKENKESDGLDVVVEKINELNIQKNRVSEARKSLIFSIIGFMVGLIFYILFLIATNSAAQGILYSLLILGYVSGFVFLFMGLDSWHATSKTYEELLIAKKEKEYDIIKRVDMMEERFEERLAKLEKK